MRSWQIILPKQAKKSTNFLKKIGWYKTFRNFHAFHTHLKHNYPFSLALFHQEQDTVMSSHLPKYLSKFPARWVTPLFIWMVVSFTLSGCMVLSGCDLVGSKSELAQAQAKWQKLATTSYSFDSNKACFCAFRGPVKVIVTNNKVTAIQDPSTGKPLSYSLDWFSTIEQIFTQIEDLKKGNPKTLDVSYDPIYGFPVTITYNQSDQIADEEFSLTISNFKPLK